MEDNMKNIKLCVPQIEDLWFRKECMEDRKTMAYNAGYNVSYGGYHYESGCIDFPEEKFERWYKETMPRVFYAYVLDQDLNKFVGYCNFKLDKTSGRASMGIVIKDEFRGQGYMTPALKLLIEEAKKQGVKVLTDSVPVSRENALKVFYKLGFKNAGQFTVEKFGKEEIVMQIVLNLE